MTWKSGAHQGARGRRVCVNKRLKARRLGRAQAVGLGRVPCDAAIAAAAARSATAAAVSNSTVRHTVIRPCERLLAMTTPCLADVSPQR